MIEKRDIIDYMEREEYRPQTAPELFENMKVTVASAEFDEILAELEATGQIIETRYGRFGLPHRMNLAVGRLQGNKAGFAFLLVPRPDTDVFISADKLNSAMHGDLVIARLLPGKPNSKKREGEVIHVLDRARTTIVGRLEKTGRQHGFIIPDNKRISRDFYVDASDFNNAKDGDKVVAEITAWAHQRRAPEAKITEILGAEGAPGVDILSAIKRYDLPTEFPPEVIQVAQKVPQDVNPNQIKGRLDLRDLPTITIDGEDARDLDDAISLARRSDGGYTLGVHIADVGNYVTAGSILDIEALKRGTSVYFPDRVLPMIPPELSNGICSLHPGVDRLTLSVLMDINTEGVVTDYKIRETVIHSDARFSYKEANQFLEQKQDSTKYRNFGDMLQVAKELAAKLASRRKHRGSINFDFPEAKITVDPQTGRPIDIQPRSRTVADNIIEEFMLLANETVAEHCFWLEIPFIYRVHDEPSADKMQELGEFLQNFNIYLKGSGNGDIHPKSLQEALAKADILPEEQLINTVILRSMKRAEYSEICGGHFGLAAKYYTHFTSPIRRYPDLFIHRVLKMLMHQNDRLTEKQIDQLKPLAIEAAAQSTSCERKADEAERDIDDLMKVEYMAGNIGNVYKGLISGVVNSGFFVELPNTIEGFVHLSSLHDDYYRLEREKYQLIGEQTGRTLRIGDEIKIRVYDVSYDERQIEFRIVK